MNFTITKNAKILSFTLIAIGIIALAAGIASPGDEHPFQRLWANLLIDNFFFLGIALYGTFFIALHTAAKAGWNVMLNRIAEAMGQYLWIAAPLMLVILYFGGHSLFHWMDHDVMDPGSEHYDALIAGKQSYLNLPFFMSRAAIYLGGWLLFTYLFRKNSTSEDKEGGTKFFKRNFKLSAGFLPFFAVTSVTASWDWLMSIDTHWFSTLYGWYIFSGIWVSGIVMMFFITYYLKSAGFLPGITANHFHELGRMMFAISFLWTYLWFSQFMLIWYSNIPEEVTYFVTRIEHYAIPFFGMLIFNFVLPMILLMSRDSKRDSIGVAFIAPLVFIGQWINAYVLVMPGTVGDHWHIGFMEIGLFLGFLGLFLFVVLRALSKVPLAVQKHPLLVESEHFHM